MRSADKRRVILVDTAVSRYARRIQEGFNPRRADGDSVAQEANFREALERAELRADQVRQVLMEHGVPSIQFVTYRGFGLHLDKLCRDYSDETLRLRVLDAIARWQCYGCSPAVLQAITKTVFALDMSNPSESCKP